jgi:pyrroline-5-carboxylate reductase
MKIGFYGYGHLARAVAAGLLKKELSLPEEIFVLAKSEKTLDRAKAEGFTPCKDATELLSFSDLIVLAIKPATFRELSPTLSKMNFEGKRVVSLMASIGLEQLKESFSCPVLRVMPTVAIEQGNDIIGITDPQGFEDVKALFEGLGSVHVLEERQLDRLTVTASCGPGFAAKVLDSYACSCEKLGFSKEEALAITAAVFSFASSRKGEDPFKSLEAQVATKGGVTEAGNLAMGDTLENAFDLAFQTALEKAAPKKDS